MFFYKSATYFGEEQGVEQRYGQETQWHNLNETAEGYYIAIGSWIKDVIIIPRIPRL